MNTLKRFSFMFALFFLGVIFSSFSNVHSLEVNQKNKTENSFILGLKLFKDELYLPATNVFSEFLMKNRKSSKIIIARFLLAESFRKTKQYELAKKNFKLILSENNNRLENLFLKSYIRLGEILALQGENLKASLYFERAFIHFYRIKSESISKLLPLIKKNFLRASFLRYEEEDCERSIKNLRQLEKISGWKNSLKKNDYVSYLFVKGDCAFRSRDFELSKYYFSKILSIKTSVYIKDQSKFRLAISFDELNETKKSLEIYLQIVNQKKFNNLQGYLFSLWRLSEISEGKMKWNVSLKYLKLLRKSIEKHGVMEDEKFTEFYGLSKIRIHGIEKFLKQIEKRNLEIKKRRNNFERKTRERKNKIVEIQKKYLTETKQRNSEILKREEAYLRTLAEYRNEVRKLEQTYLRSVKQRKKKVRALKLENIRKLDSYKEKVRQLEAEYLRKVKQREKDVRTLKLQNIKKLDSYKKKVHQLELEYLSKVKKREKDVRDLKRENLKKLESYENKVLKTEQEYLLKIKERKSKIRLQEREYRSKVVEREKMIRSRKPLFR